jgi:hypothetical protein
MKRRSLKNTGIALSFVLPASAFLIIQLSGAWRVTANTSSQPTNESLVSSRIIAEYPAVEVVSERDDHTRVWNVVRDVEVTDPVTGEKRIEQTESLIKEKGCGVCYQDADGNWQPSLIEWERSASGFQITRAGYVATKGPLSQDPFEYSVGGMVPPVRPVGPHPLRWKMAADRGGGCSWSARPNR